MSSLGDMIAGTADGVVEAGVNQAFADYNRRQNYKMWERANDKTFAQSQQAQKDAASNMVEGYRKAGLNPAALQGTAFAAATSQGAPMPSNDVSVSQSVLGRMTEKAQLANIYAQNDLIKAQADNLRAGTRKTGAEADTIEFKYKNDVDYRSMLTSWVQGAYGDEYNEWRDKHPDLVADGEHMNGMAFLLFHQNALDSLLRDTERDVKFDEADFNAIVADMRKQDKHVANAVAQLAADQRNELYGRLKNLAIMDNLLEASRDETIAKTGEIGEKVKNLQAEREKLATETANMLVDSPALAAYKGDKKAAALGSINSTVKFFGGVAKAALSK